MCRTQLHSPRANPGNRQRSVALPLREKVREFRGAGANHLVGKAENMKANLIVWTVAAAMGLCAVAQTTSNPQPASSAPPAEAKTNAVPGVNAFMRAVDHYRGRVQVEGLVKTFSAKNQTLGLVDVAGCEKCDQATCTELVLPVRWTGTMPSVGQAVRVSGEVQKKRGKLVFVASEVKKVQPLENKK